MRIFVYKDNGTVKTVTPSKDSVECPDGMIEMDSDNIPAEGHDVCDLVDGALVVNQDKLDARENSDDVPSQREQLAAVMEWFDVGDLSTIPASLKDIAKRAKKK